MKKALISPNEKVFNPEGVEIGERVAEVAAQDFPIAAPFFWVDCSDDVVADEFYFSNDGEILPTPMPIPVEAVQPISQGAQTL